MSTDQKKEHRPSEAPTKPEPECAHEHAPWPIYLIADEGPYKGRCVDCFGEAIGGHSLRLRPGVAHPANAPRSDKAKSEGHERLIQQAKRAAKAWEEDPTSLATENAIRELGLRADSSVDAPPLDYPRIIDAVVDWLRHTASGYGLLRSLKAKGARDALYHAAEKLEEDSRAVLGSRLDVTRPDSAPTRNPK